MRISALLLTALLIPTWTVTAQDTELDTPKVPTRIGVIDVPAPAARREALPELRMPLFDPHPLSDGDREVLRTASDNLGTINEASLITLLKNARHWSDSEAGAVVPDYAEIRATPDNWRGQRCLIEGELFRVIRPQLRGRLGWENVEGLVLRVDHTREKPEPQDFVIVYITDPPVWRWRDEDQGLVWEAGHQVRITGRFYKIDRFETQRGVQAVRAEVRDKAETKNYLTFVGHAPTQLVPHYDGGQTTSSLSRQIGGVFIILAAVAYLAYRSRGFRKRLEGQSRLQDYIRERQAERESADRAEAETVEELPLPEDPIAALDMLSHMHTEPATLQDDAASDDEAEKPTES